MNANTNNTIEDLTSKIETIKQRLEASKGTPAEAVFRDVLAQLEAQLPQPSSPSKPSLPLNAENSEPEPNLDSSSEEKTSKPERFKSYTHEEIIEKFGLEIEPQTLSKWINTSQPRKNHIDFWQKLNAEYKYVNGKWRTHDSLYSAYGWIRGQIKETRDEEGKFVDKKLIYKGKEYPCKYNKEAAKVYDIRKFSEHAANVPGQILRVFPVWTHFPERDKEPRFRFDIAGWGIKPLHIEIEQFHLRGIWQFIPVCRRPVISVYRNDSFGEEDKLKANHCNVLWKDSPIKPFRYNPKAETQGDKYFVDVTANWDSNRNCLYINKLNFATKWIPKYLKPIKSVAKKN